MRRLAASLALLLLGTAAAGQSSAKKPLTHDANDRWHRITGELLSDDGRWVAYAVDPNVGDGTLHVRATGSEAAYAVPRGGDPRFTGDGRFVVFRIAPEREAVRAAKRAKKKADEQPRDSLGILDLASGTISRIAEVKSFAVADSASVVAYLLHRAAASDTGRGARDLAAAADTAATPGRAAERGAPLVLRVLTAGAEHRYEHVVAFALGSTGRLIAYVATGPEPGVFAVDPTSGTARLLLSGKGSYRQLTIDRAGRQLAFVSDVEEGDLDPRPYRLYHWRQGADAARAVPARGLPAGWAVSEHGTLEFSERGRRLYFGSAPRPEPAPNDSTPDDERVKVDIWHWQDSDLQPVQLRRLDDERKRSYRAVWPVGEDRVVQLATIAMPDLQLGEKGEADVAVGSTDLPYRHLRSWDSPAYRDYYLVNVVTGAARRLVERVQATGMSLSPQSRYAAWYDYGERAWFAAAVTDGAPSNISRGLPHPVWEEDHDQPSPPGPHGSAGWLRGDRGLVVYDRYDVWTLDPTGRSPARNVTGGVGRRERIELRLVRLDPDETALDVDAVQLLRAFDTRTKASGFYRARLSAAGSPERLVMEPRRYGMPRQAKRADVLLFTRESFTEFPDLWVSDRALAAPRRVSDANPQQAEYRWGQVELVEWQGGDGRTLEGLLYKPADFDPSRRYPMIVNFYERNADGLHRHRAPEAHRSTINYTFYVSRGYLVFVPDVRYKVGWPGESAVQAVVPGVLSLTRQGFVDSDRICLQGHSWGGYQIAFILTRTTMFRCAAAGAPVANMTSAYGGIRWGSGLSRMFQYERTQSRIGATLWEAPMRYIENSPLFWIDKVETPVLILHNDEDGAVPWEQGIELFVALRRLGKPAWLVNYNGQPHWPITEANKRDWQTRLQQFFDHYLLDVPAPVWLADGVPAILKGKTLGLESAETASHAEGSGGR